MPVLQILTLFQANCTIIHTSFLTKRLKTIPFERHIHCPRHGEGLEEDSTRKIVPIQYPLFTVNNLPYMSQYATNITSKDKNVRKAMFSAFTLATAQGDSKVGMHDHSLFYCTLFKHSITFKPRIKEQQQGNRGKPLNTESELTHGCIPQKLCIILCIKGDRIFQ